MKKTRLLLILSLCLYGTAPISAQQMWRVVPARLAATDVNKRLPSKFLAVTVDEQLLKQTLTASAKGSHRLLELPMPDGSFQTFRVTRTPVLPDMLAAKYPGIETYTGISIENPAITAKLDYTPGGFHCMVYDGDNTSLIDPVGNTPDGHYIAHYKRDESRQDENSILCQTDNNSKLTGQGILNAAAGKTTGTENKVTNGYELRKYRLALACSHQYAAAVTAPAAPTKATVLAKMTTSINRVNGIYERELSITMVFADKEDTLIFPVTAGDPYGPENSNAGALLEINQKMCDSLIGDANYDIGHAFTSGAGGLSQVGIVCKSSTKAQCVTGSSSPMGDGFDIDYVAHEMGHEYGADHTFNNSQSGGCAGNAVQLHAYEPGSGSTIMAYAGLCTSDNLVAHSDAYFHATSLQQIQHYVAGAGDACAVKTPTGNKQPAMAPFATGYTIPYRTPFELTAPIAADSTGDAQITYCWEEWDLGGFGLKLTGTTVAGPLFRSYTPVKSPTRYFPNMKMVRNGISSNAGIDNASGEKTPDVARSLNFKVTSRAIRNGRGCFVLPDDSVHIEVINTNSLGFTVTSQNVSGIVYSGYSHERVTWNVAGTTAAPINAANVDIYLSADTGYTWPYHLGTFPNTGSATVSFPNPDTNINAARIKVKGTGNIFFNVNSKDFKLVRNFESAILLSPVPARNVLHVTTDNTGVLQAAVFNMVGRKEWEGSINGQADIPVYTWARGVYIMKLLDDKNQRVIKKFVVE